MWIPVFIQFSLCPFEYTLLTMPSSSLLCFLSFLHHCDRVKALLIHVLQMLHTNAHISSSAPPQTNTRTHTHTHTMTENSRREVIAPGSSLLATHYLACLLGNILQWQYLHPFDHITKKTTSKVIEVCFVFSRLSEYMSRLLESECTGLPHH